MQSSASIQSSSHDEDKAEKSNGEGAPFSQDSKLSPPILPQEALNGGSAMPPHQVYNNSSVERDTIQSEEITGLQAQFQSLEMKPGEECPSENQGAGDGKESDEEQTDDPVKLFVGQVPKTMNEEDIFPTFDAFGPLKDVAIIRDKHTGLHRGCAFVTFWSSSDAESAQHALHDKYTFPGGRRPAQVKPAEPSVPENKLFIGMLSRKAGEAEVRELFAPFGEIQEIYMIRNTDGSSKCAAFLRFVKREAAIKAIESLHNNVVMDGSARPLIVKFADTKQQRHARHLRNTRREQLLASMGGAGPPYPGFQVQHVPQVPPPLGLPHTGHQYSIPQYSTAYHGAGTPTPTHHAPPPHHPYVYPPHHYSHGSPYAYQSRHDMRAPNPRPREGPAGANLFVYHLPHDLTDADLATAFNPFGNVVSAKVYVDKYTGESKGFGFVSYDSVMSAESAIEQMNGFQIGNKRLKVQHKRVNNPAGVHQQSHPQTNSQA